MLERTLGPKSVDCEIFSWLERVTSASKDARLKGVDCEILSWLERVMSAR